MARIKLVLLLAFVGLNTLVAQEKKILSVNDYDGWKSLKNPKISNNGKWVSYEINPQKGDGYLYLYNTETNKLVSVFRGKNAAFSPENDFLAFKIVPEADTVRALKLQKTKNEKMPKDTLCIWNLKTGTRKTYPRIQSYKVPEKEGNWVVAHFLKPLPEKKKEKADTIAQDSTKLALKTRLKEQRSPTRLC